MDARLFVTRTFRDLVHKTFRDPDLSGPGSFVTCITTVRDLIKMLRELINSLVFLYFTVDLSSQP